VNALKSQASVLITAQKSAKNVTHLVNSVMEISLTIAHLVHQIKNLFFNHMVKTLVFRKMVIFVITV